MHLEGFRLRLEPFFMNAETFCLKRTDVFKVKNPMAALHRVNVKINIYQQIRTECEPNMLAISLNAELSVLISLSVKVAFFPFTIQPFMR